MNDKQDRAAPRTVSDILRKYNFGRTFAETMGLAKAAQTTAIYAANTSEKTEEKVDNLVVDKMKSTKDTQTLSIDGGGMELEVDDNVLAYLNTDDLGIAELCMKAFIYGVHATTARLVASSFTIKGEAATFGVENYAALGIDPMSGDSYAEFMRLNGKILEWKDNGDGTFTLIGM